MVEQFRDVHYALKIPEREILKEKTSEQFGFVKRFLYEVFYWASEYGRKGALPLLRMIRISLLGALVYAVSIFISRRKKVTALSEVVSGIQVKQPVEKDPSTVGITKTDDSILSNHDYVEEKPILESPRFSDMIDIRNKNFWKGWFHAFYFSAITTFGIGFRELNIGTWLSRLDPRRGTLRSTGWVQIVAGIQRIIGVILFAIFVISFFNLPLE